MLKDQRDTGEGIEGATAGPVQPPQAADTRSCSVAGCAGSYLARGYCIKHYYQVKRHGAVQPDGLRRSRPCGIAGCPDPSYARGQCLRHYRQNWRQALGRPRPGRGALRGLPAEARCREGDCLESPFARGLCRLHYIMVRYQDLLSGNTSA